MNAQGNSWAVNWGLVPLRLVVGLVFAVHGAQKLFVFGLGGAAGFMAKVGIPLPSVAAVVVMAVEILGGLALILGLGTRLAAAHQLHGAIGMTREYPLHHFTRRLRAWSFEWGTGPQCGQEIGALAVRSGAERLWPLLTGTRGAMP